MENASKALIISAGVLIAILLLTLFSYLFMKMSSSTSEVYDMMSKHEKDEFNQQFFNYEGRGIRTNADPLTPQEVATLINLAQDSKEKTKFSANVAIMLGSENLTNQASASEWLAKQMQDSTDREKRYDCESVTIDQTTLLVKQVTLKVHP